MSSRSGSRFEEEDEGKVCGDFSKKMNVREKGGREQREAKIGSRNEDEYEEEQYEFEDFEENEDENAGQSWTEIDFHKVKLGKQIGGGGFAVVYEGSWGNKRVALKTLFDPRQDKETKQEFMDELFIMSQLNHPNIVKLLGACVKPPNMFMCMPLYSGSLFDLLHGENATEISNKRVVKMGIEIASGLEYLHSQNPAIIHRDIKSQNILVSDDMTIKLCDFGLCNTNQTTAGTPAYMAPELLKNSVFSKKVDVYAFGVLLLEMFSRSIPYATWDAIDIHDFVCNGKRLQVPLSCPKQCGKLIERCWDADPDRRPAFQNIVRALTRISTTLRDKRYVDEVSCGVDSFDTLSASMAKHK